MPQCEPAEDLPAEAPGPAVAEPASPGTLPAAHHLSLLVLAGLASVYALQWASAVCIPVLVAILFSYALSPIVDWLQQRGVPRGISAALLVIGLVLSTALGVYALSEQASKLVELLPQAAQKLNAVVRATHGGDNSTFASVQKAAARLEQAAAESTQAAAVSRGVQRVLVAR